LRKHYNNFIELAKEVNKAVETKNKKSLSLFLQKDNRQKELQKYGFYKFILKKQFRFT
jgi:hypothetical protein